MNVIRRQVLLILCSFLFSFSSFSQTDSCNLQISLLTCGAGEDLYSVFGHSGIRVKNLSDHTDLIYNYGTFDFEDPDFYIKFIKGKLLYSLSVQRLNNFLYEYRMERRSVIEQQLSLSCEEKTKLDAALRDNAKEENRYYFYQFFFDNCSTRVRDIIANNLNEPVIFKNILPKPVPTFRIMIHQYLDAGHQYWGELGIDLLLGSLIDRKPTNSESMFLPDMLMMGFDSALEHNQSVIASKTVMLSGAGIPGGDIADANGEVQPGFEVTPLMFTALLLLVGGGLTFVNRAWVKRFLNIFDVILFFMIGGAGCLILFMWFGTEHDLCSRNYNLLWALPTHLLISFVMLKKYKWVRKYFSFTAVLYLILLFAWAFLPQGMNPAFLPVVLLAGIRSFKRSSLTGRYE